MGTVIIREMARIRSDDGAWMVDPTLVTDANGLAIKTQAMSGSAVDVGPLTKNTWFIEIETTADVRVAVWPKEHVASPTWSSANRYPVGAKVIFSGGLYTCATATNPGESPTTHASKWTKFAATANHHKVASGATELMRVYPGAKLSLLGS
jgi:hypothetical protein